MIKRWWSPTGVSGETVTLPQEKIDQLAKASEAMLNLDPIPKAQLRPFTGLATWVAGIMPQIAVYTTMLWAALAGLKIYVCREKVG